MNARSTEVERSDVNPSVETPPRVALAAPHRDAVHAARGVIEQRGNAIDAALAAAAVLTVVAPHMCSLGGDLIALVRAPDGSEVCVNASGAYGSAVPVEKLFAGLVQMPISGPLTVSVPGLVSGWAVLLERWGSLTLGEILAPAIALARDGMAVSPGLAETLVEESASLRGDAGIGSLFYPGGAPAVAGQVIVQPALADTLQTLAQDGLDSFYAGHTAERLARAFEGLGVPVTGADLAAHKARVEPPLALDLEKLRISTAGPNSQGFTFLRSLGALHLLGAGDLSSVDADILAELLYSGDALRDAALADPLVAAVDVDAELSTDALRRAGEQATRAASGGERTASPASLRPGGDTVAVTAVGADGSAISLIQSVFHSFGAGILEPTTGVVLHNRAAFFTLEEGSPNRIAPGKRPAHTLTPVLIEHRDGAIAAHGTMGGKAQSQIQVQLALRVLGGSSPAEAVAAPRFVVGGLELGSANDYVFREADLERDACAQLERGSLRVVVGEPRDSSVGHSMIARRSAQGELSAGADPRSDGGVVVR